jgi:MFS family permease
MEQIQKAIKDSRVLRWGILILISYTMAANYYFYDALSPLKSELTKHLGFANSDFGWVVGFYAFPNTFLLMAILGGIILDKIGIRITGLAFIIFMVIGALVTVYASTDYYNAGGFGYHFMGSFLTNFSPSVKMMALGMLLFGLGAETSCVVVSKSIVKWFKGKEIALAFGVNLGIARLGTALAIKLGPRMVNPDWTKPIWIAVLLICIALLAFLVYMVFDYKLDRQIKNNGITEPEDEFHFSDFIKLITNRSFLYITALCVTFYAAVFPFIKFAVDFFHNKYNVPEKIGGDITFWLPMATALFTPIFGSYVDKKGKSATLMIYGSLLLVFVHLAFAFTSINPYVLISLLGIAFSLVPAAMWPAVSKIVSINKIGTAYGTMFSLQNLGLFAMPIIVGKVLDLTNKGVTAEMQNNGSLLNYSPTMLLFAVFGVLGVIFALLLKADDKTSGYGLELPSNKTSEKKSG